MALGARVVGEEYAAKVERIKEIEQELKASKK
jgi:hypothetical protein